MNWKQHIDQETHPALRAHIEIRDPNNNMVAIINGAHQDAHDNACAISAAGDMRAALRRCYEVFKMHEVDTVVSLQVEMALIKAGGL